MKRPIPVPVNNQKKAVPLVIWLIAKDPQYVVRGAPVSSINPSAKQGQEWRSSLQGILRGPFHFSKLGKYRSSMESVSTTLSCQNLFLTCNVKNVQNILERLGK